MKRHLRIVLPVLALTLLVAGLAFNAALAQGSAPTDDDVNAIAKQLYCPVCENTPLDVCPTEACRQWRELIRQQLADGWTEDQIKQYFVENYGARVLGEPPRSGLNWVVYLLPPALILAGAFVLFRAMRTWMKPTVTEPAAGAGEMPQSAAPVSDEYISKFEEELRKRK